MNNALGHVWPLYDRNPLSCLHRQGGTSWDGQAATQSPGTPEREATRVMTMLMREAGRTNHEAGALLEARGVTAIEEG